MRAGIIIVIFVGMIALSGCYSGAERKNDLESAQTGSYLPTLTDVNKS